MADWQVYLMMAVIVGAMLFANKLMYFTGKKDNKDEGKNNNEKKDS